LPTVSIVAHAGVTPVNSPARARKGEDSGNPWQPSVGQDPQTLKIGRLIMSCPNNHDPDRIEIRNGRRICTACRDMYQRRSRLAVQGKTDTRPTHRLNRRKGAQTNDRIN
jgi:hypothetical protein